MKEYKARLIDNAIAMYIEAAPVILIEGAKAVGKSETCKQFMKYEYNLLDELVKDAVAFDPNIILDSARPVLIDEWHKLPSIWDFLRRKVDEGLSPGSFLLTGSNPRFNHDLHSGAGRIITLKMWPFSIEERQLTPKKISIKELLYNNINISGECSLEANDYIDDIYKSGFPEIREYPEFMAKKLLEDYTKNIVNHDLEENGVIVRKPNMLLSWLKAYAAVSATTAAYQTISDIVLNNSEEVPSKKTSVMYRENLEMLNIIEEVPTWLAMGKLTVNLGRTPKHFLMEPALIVSLLKIDKEDLLFTRANKSISKFNKTLFGQVFESYIYQSLRVYCDINNYDLSHFRTSKGDKEIDFIVQKGRRILAIEVKAKTTKINEDDVKHLNWFEKEIQDEYEIKKIVVYAGKFAYKTKDNVYVIPAGMLAS